MRKYVIGGIITVMFIAYSLVLRHQHSPPIMPPASLSQNSGSGSSTTTPTTSTTPALSYKDGTYNGSVVNAFYGNVQVAATITGGKITNVSFLQSPNDNPNSININQQAMPFLKQEAIKSQSANVSIITGATLTSQAFVQSLSNALSQAK